MLWYQSTSEETIPMEGSMVAILRLTQSRSILELTGIVFSLLPIRYVIVLAVHWHTCNKNKNYQMVRKETC